MGELPAPLPVVSAAGVRIRTAAGQELIDGMASWWSAIHGYRHPALDAAAKEQLERMAHVMFGGLTHEPATELAQTLLPLLPASLQHVFFCDSGSVAVEVAIKMALQYWLGRGETGRDRLLSLRGGYHGDTFGAMAACDPVTGMHRQFRGLLPEHFFAPRPEPRFGQACRDEHIRDFETLLQQQHQRIAAVILEPIVQGAGGMWFYSADWLRRARNLCDHFEIPLIADEIATGFGRSGRLFACEHAGIQPDILCLGKALTGGYLSLAATICSPEIASGICAGPAGKLMHGPTFMANPLACAIAVANLRVLLDSSWSERVAGMEAQLHRGLAPASAISGVAEVRCLGAIGVIEMRQDIDRHRAQQLLLEHGVWLRPFGRLLYTMPPYICTAEELATVTAAMCATADACG